LEILLVFLVGVLLVFIFTHVTGTLHAFGIEPRTPSTAYNFWSGAGSDLGEVVLIGAVIGLFRKHNCSVTGCWRLAKHLVPDTPYYTCQKHHPAIPDKITPEHIAEVYAMSHCTNCGAPARNGEVCPYCQTPYLGTVLKEAP
jgi:ribosomal protein L32